MRLKELLKKMNEALNEIAMERYLSVEPSDFTEDGKSALVLYQGNDKEDDILFKLNDNMTDKDIREIAKKYFNNITDDIRVQWY